MKRLDAAEVEDIREMLTDHAERSLHMERLDVGLVHQLVDTLWHDLCASESERLKIAALLRQKEAELEAAKDALDAADDLAFERDLADDRDL